MENVVAFNNELSGLYESKPPISKAKMAAITKAAMRAIKFYKHVVQSVEKFILKCKPEYKVPGLYVIDSIVRQSRHQFGVEKDVFAPRFARNMKDTFANLFRCAPEDKSRIIRVLNLWQKNNVFAPDVIQPIFDLADPSHPIYQMPPQQQSSNSLDISATSNGMNVSNSGMDTSGMGSMGAANQSSSAEDKLMMPDLSIGHQKVQTSTLDQSTIRQLQQIQQLLIRQTANENASSTSGTMSQSDSVKFNKKLLDYDYGDEDEEEKKSTSPHVPNLLDNNNLKQLLKDPNVLRQLQTLQNFQKFKQQEEKQHKLNELRMQEEAFEKHIQNVLKNSANMEAPENTVPKEVEFVSEESKIEVINLDGNDSRSPSPDRDRYKRRRSRSRSRERPTTAGGRGGDARRRRSRSRSSRSRSPTRTNRRRTSRERDRERDRNVDRNRDKDKERERERRRKGLPDIKKEHLSVCSTTLWVGHLSKLVYQEELSDTFGKYGDIVSIDQIIPRGCAFIVMNRRQDASKAMTALKNYKLQGRAITISWAAGKGVKSKEWKDFWDLELGVTYIPWDKLEKDTDLDALEEGGIIDEDSMPDWMKEKMKQKNAKENTENSVAGAAAQPSVLFGPDGLPKIDVTQPPPQAGGMLAMPPFNMAPPMGAPPLGPPPMGAPPRMMTPMGVPMPGNMVPGMQMVAGMPPPHPMLMPQGMMPPGGFPPMPLDKNIPPPNMRPDGGLQPPPFMGNPGIMQPMPMPSPHQFQPNAGGNAASDDQMDIEMEDDMPNDNPQHPPQMSFNQPPPMFQQGAGAGPGGPGAGPGPGGFPEGSFQEGGPPPGSDIGDEYGGRERNRGGNNSRWGARDDRDQNRDRGNRGGDQPDSGDMWHENGPPMGGPPNFNDNSRRGGGPPGNMNPFDMNNHPQRQEFFDMRHGGGPEDFNERRGGGGEFFPNMQNRFNQPNSLMQMRIQPPGAFNNRMNGSGPGPGMGGGGPGMFMRGQGPRPQGGPQGGGFGGGFNNRNPFDRDIDSGNRMRGGGRGMNDRRGGGRGGRGGGHNNWRDKDEEDDGGIFKRRGGNRFGGGGGREGHDDGGRMNRDRERQGGRRPMNDRNSRDRFDRSRDRREGGNDRFGRNRRMSSENRESSRPKDEYESSSPKQQGMSEKQVDAEKPQASNIPLDTEEDWDQELSEHDFDSTKSTTNHNSNPKTDQRDDTAAVASAKSQTETSTALYDPYEGHEESYDKPDESFAAPTHTEDEQPSKKEERINSVNTPLYDEPAPASDNKSYYQEQNTENVPQTQSTVEDQAAPVESHQPEPEPTVEASTE